MLLYSSQFIAMGSDIDIPVLKRQLGMQVTGPGDSRFGASLPLDLMIRIFRTAAEEGAHPRFIALTCKNWNMIMHGELKGTEKGTCFARVEGVKLLIPYRGLNSFMKDCMHLFWQARLRNGIFRYQPEGAQADDVRLSTMYMDNANGELILPAAVSSDLCVTRMTETFVRPVGDNTRKTLVLLLTLSELKLVAEQISTDPSFLQNVDLADLSQNAVCALIRCGGDDFATWGFRYTILKFCEMSNLPIWKIYTHEKVEVCMGVWWRGVGMGSMWRCWFLNPN